MPRPLLGQIRGDFCRGKDLTTNIRGAISRSHAGGLTIARYVPICSATDARSLIGRAKKVPFSNSRDLSSSSRSSKNIRKGAGFPKPRAGIRYAWVETWSKVLRLWHEYWKRLFKPPPEPRLATTTKSPTLSDPAAVESGQRSQFIDSPDSLATFLDTLTSLPTDPPSLYLDLEGINLSRHGGISILQIYVLPHNRTYLIDIHTLGKTAFQTASAGGQTLKTILESSVIPKVFFDVRNDSDALYAHFGINLAGIQDLQLMELAARSQNYKYFNGLSQCIDRDGGLSFKEKLKWKAAKKKGVRLFAPEKGGSYDVFNVRPLADDMRMYCIQDVQVLPRLRRAYASKLSAKWVRTVEDASRRRVITSQGETYDSKGIDRAVASNPWQLGSANSQPQRLVHKKKARVKKKTRKS